MTIKSTTVVFLNRPNADGTVTEEISVAGCAIAPHGSPTMRRKQVAIHLPRTFKEKVDGAWIKYDGNFWHVIGTEAPRMESNTPTPWDRYAIAEKIY